MASTTCSHAKGLGVWLRSFQDRLGLAKGRVEEHVGLICWILGLRETIKFLVGRAPLAEYRVPFRGKRRILFGLEILLCEGNHVGLNCTIKLPARI
jgi:hypothetical protein